MTELDKLIKAAQMVVDAQNDSYTYDMEACIEALSQAVGQAKAVEAVAWLHHTVDPNGFVSDMQVSFSNHSILNETSREPLYTTPPSVDALIADAVAKEREACAQIALPNWRIAEEIRARSGG